MIFLKDSIIIRLRPLIFFKAIYHSQKYSSPVVKPAGSGLGSWIQFSLCSFNAFPPFQAFCYVQDPRLIVCKHGTSSHSMEHDVLDPWDLQL